jgi:hypothetical protein
MLFALALLAATAPSASDASKLTLSPPATIAEIDTRKVKGEPLRLAWSPDGKQLYLQMVERDRQGTIKSANHYMVPIGGGAPARVDQEPAWSAEYWGWKSAQAAPGRPDLKIAVEEQQKRVSSTATPMGGDLARGGPEGSGAMTPVGSGVAGEAMSASMQSQMAHYYTLKLKGEVVGEFVNAAAIPGLTFGWGPANSALIAFANRDGRVVIMDDQGRKQEIAASKSALLPAWIDNGTRLAYLEKTAKNKFDLKVVEVARPAQ